MSEIIAPNTPEWFEARCGRLTASRLYDATARQKNGKWYAARANYMTELAVERLTGRATAHYVTPAMQWGIDTEPDARAAYEYLLNVDVVPVGFAVHPEIPMLGATPDGGVGDEGLTEFKCPTSMTHVATLLSKEVDPQYIAQMAGELLCFPARKWVDYGTYDPRMPPELRLWVFRFERDANAEYIEQLEKDAREFLAELDDVVARLRSTGRIEEKAA